MVRLVIVAVVLCVVSVSGFVQQTQRSSVTAVNAKSQAVPFLEAPAALDGSMAGDVGFDPFGFSSAWLDVSGDLFITI